MKKLSEAARIERNRYNREYKRRTNANLKYWERRAAKRAGANSESDTVSDTPSDTVTDSVTDSVTCKECKQIFEPKRVTGKFCSDKCRVAFNRKKPLQR